MIARILPLLILAGCTSIDVRVKSPAEIVQIACAWKKPDAARCGSVVGLSFPALSPCVIYVPPLTDETRWIHKHERDHCRDGLNPHEYAHLKE